MKKYCYKCQETKSFDAFGRNKSKKDGMSTECKPCKRQNDKKYYITNSEKVKQTVAKYRQENPQKVIQVKHEWYLRNTDYVKNKTSIWSKDNVIKVRKSKRKYTAANRGKCNALLAKRRAAKLQATPSWFEKNLVKTVYLKAKEWGFEVDHIVPLQGKTVCGLHCWANLQLLDSSLNSGKKNYYWPDMP